MAFNEVGQGEVAAPVGWRDWHFFDGLLARFNRDAVSGGLPDDLFAKVGANEGLVRTLTQADVGQQSEGMTEDAFRGHAARHVLPAAESAKSRPCRNQSVVVA